MEDNDQKLYFYDVQGESVYTNPPDTNQPTLDHGLDEEHVWAWNLTAYNQFVIKNQYTKSFWSSTNKSHVPFWGQKLLAPSFFKEEKYKKFLKQWEYRVNFEILKMRQAIQYRRGDKAQYQRFKEEVEAYLSWTDNQMFEDELKDIYVTDHVPR